jgi:hypothetical protein
MTQFELVFLRNIAKAVVHTIQDNRNVIIITTAIFISKRKMLYNIFLTKKYHYNYFWMNINFT